MGCIVREKPLPTRVSRQMEGGATCSHLPGGDAAPEGRRDVGQHPALHALDVQLQDLYRPPWGKGAAASCTHTSPHPFIGKPSGRPLPGV